MNRLSILETQIQPSKYHQLLLKSFIDPEQIKKIVFGNHYHFIEQIHQIIAQNRQLFNHSDIEDLSRKQQRKFAAKQMLKILKSYKISDLKKDAYKFSFGLYGLVNYSLGLAIKTNIQYMLYLKTLVTFGTTQKHKQFIEKAFSLEHLGCFALTQFYHGSFTQGIKTIAIYDHQSNNFKVSTNDKQGMKFWIGAAAQIANMAVIWAQLIVNNVSYGPHPFVLQIRDFKTHQLLPGILIGDCGFKAGLNGIDNGYFILQNVNIPKQNLLNALGDVDEKGNYVSKIKSNQKRFGLHMSPLSSGRSALSYCTLSCSTNALAIALKYSCQRRQFTDPKNPDLKQTLLIDYPLTKSRLFPLVAQNFIYMIGGLFILKKYIQNSDIFTDPDSKLVPQLHAFSAILKAKSTWFTNKTITQCRQILGGHGYSSFSRLGQIYLDNDVHSTWQGDNNMLIQQTSKFLFKIFLSNQKLSLLDFNLKPFDQNFVIEVTKIQQIDTIQKIFLQLIAFKLKNVREQIFKLKSLNLSPSEEWNKLQPYFCHTLSLSFGDYIYFSKAKQYIEQTKNKQTKQFLKNCLILWSFNIILNEKFGKYQMRVKIQQKVIQLCENMTADCIKFIQIIKSPNFIIDSPFISDQPMKQYINLLMSAKGTFQRVQWFDKLIQLRK